MDKARKLYIMISKTDTGIGSVIRWISGYSFNHVSLTLDRSFHTWVSFARYIHDTPIYGGFIRETAERYLAKGQRIDVRIFAVDISPSHFAKLEELFAQAGNPNCGLLYNTFDILAACFGHCISIPGAYTCLGFANAILGTHFSTIKVLSDTMEANLFYEGALADLVQDSGSRDEPYFSRLGTLRGTAYSLRHIAQLICRMIQKSTAIPTTLPLNK